MNIYTASTYRRIVAYIIDKLIEFFLWTPVLIQAIRSYMDEGAFRVEWRWVIVCIVLVISYHWLFLYFMNATVGKMVMRLKLVNAADPGQDLGLLQTLIRVLADRLSLFFGHALRSLALLRFDRTHISDWVAETRVVQDTPRVKEPRRRWIFVIFIFIYSAATQFTQIYQFAQHSSWDSQEITYTPDVPTED